MEFAKSLVDGKTYPAYRVSHSDAQRLRLVCPVCKEKVFKRLRTIPNRTHMFVHHSGGHYDCELYHHSGAGANSGTSRISEALGQTYEEFIKAIELDLFQLFVASQIIEMPLDRGGFERAREKSHLLLGNITLNHGLVAQTANEIIGSKEDEVGDLCDLFLEYFSLPSARFIDRILLAIFLYTASRWNKSSGTLHSVERFLANDYPVKGALVAEVAGLALGGLSLQKVRRDTQPFTLRMAACVASYLKNLSHHAAIFSTSVDRPFRLPDGGEYFGELRNGKRNGFGRTVMSSGLIYEGQYVDDKRSGRGMLTFRDGRKYVGEWQEDKFHGQGIWYLPNGEARFSGRWENDSLVKAFALDKNLFPFHSAAPERYHQSDAKNEKMLGKKPIRDGPPQTANWVNKVFPNGARYVGRLQSDRRSGVGTYTWADGTEYVGEFKDDMRHGNGKLIWRDGSRFEGMWSEDKKNGPGTFTWNDGRKFSGHYLNDRRNGQGSVVWPNGMKLIGEFCDDRRHGVFIYTWPDGRKQVGEFRLDRPFGRCVITWPDGRRYEGDFQDEKRHGTGVWTNLSGAKYVGDYKDDKRSGHGVYTFPDGTFYSGEFLDDKFHGHGIYSWPDGRKYVGEFFGDNFEGRGLFFFRGGQRYVGEFRGDKRNGQGILYSENGLVLKSGLWKDDKLERAYDLDTVAFPFEH